MSWSETFKTILSNQNITQATLARRLDISKPALNMRFNQPGIRTTKLNEMLKAIDYKLVAVPAGKTLKENEYEVE